MSWLIIVLILLAAFGPLFWLLPSRTDRRLAKMRARARQLGLRVEMAQLPDIAAQPSARVTAGGQRREPMVRCAAYHFALPRVARAAPRWRLLRSAVDSDGPIAGWRWDGSAAGTPAYWEAMKPIVSALPADALACGALASEVVCWWRENTTAETAETSVDSIHAALAKFAELQRVTDAAARVETSDDDEA